MKTKLFTLLLALSLSVGTLLADYERVQIGDLYYNLNETNLTAEVTYRSKYNYNYNGDWNIKAANIPTTVNYNKDTYTVISIGECAFTSCTKLTNVTIPSSVNNIGNYAFQKCSILTNIEIPNSVTSIGRSAFSGCSALANIALPNSVTIIEESLFEECSSLVNVEVPNSITTIGNNAFSYCLNLTNIEIPYSLTSLGEFVFYNCSNLTIITIPSNVTNIGTGVFSNCTNLRAVYLEWGSPLSIDKGIFENTSTIYIPKCAYTAFINAPVWKDLTLAPIDVNLSVVNNVGGVVNETCGSMEIEAIPYIGYHFKRWQDGNTDNPRSYKLSQSNRNFIAEFELNKYQVTLSCNATRGSITDNQPNSDYGTEHTITATPKYGYHFTQWSDGVKENPRTFTLEQDTTFMALFAPNTCSLIIQYDELYGEVEGEQGSFDYFSEHNIQVNAKYGYHFTYWSDGVSENPRILVLTHDTTITANFAPNKYQFELVVDANEGAVEGEQGEFDYLSEHEAKAIPNVGYLFSKWSDGITDNPRTITLTRDTSITAFFEHNVHEVTVLCNPDQGSVEKSGDTYHSASCTITAIPNYGFHFTQWSDGNTENPRTFVVTQDTIFTAEFAVDRTGSCGTDLALTWTYDPEAKQLTISGEGAFNDNMQCGVEARSALEKLVFEDGVTSIGANAFANCTTLKTLILSSTISKINANAFYDCENLTTIYNYRSTPTNALSSAFDGVDKFECILFVPKTSLELYQNAPVWSGFYNKKAILQTFIVQFVDWDGTVLSEQKVLEDEAATPPADPSRTGYTFIGWDKDFSVITEDLTVTAQYKINHYRVEFRDWDNTLLKEDDVEYQTAAIAPENPSRDWYTFIGWDKDFSSITGDLVVTAQYEEGQTFDYSLLFTNGTDDSEISHDVISIKFPLPPTISGFTFLKWVIVGGDLESVIEIQAIYEVDEPSSTPDEVSVPGHKAQKLIRQGNVYILTGDRTYTLTGQKVK